MKISNAFSEGNFELESVEKNNSQNFKIPNNTLEMIFNSNR